jgi:hypothetical protein
VRDMDDLLYAGRDACSVIANKSTSAMRFNGGAGLLEA